MMLKNCVRSFDFFIYDILWIYYFRFIWKYLFLFLWNFLGKNMKIVNRILKFLLYIDGSFFLWIGMCINKKIFKNVIKWVSWDKF